MRPNAYIRVFEADDTEHKTFERMTGYVAMVVDPSRLPIKPEAADRVIVQCPAPRPPIDPPKPRYKIKPGKVTRPLWTEECSTSQEARDVYEWNMALWEEQQERMD